MPIQEIPYGHSPGVQVRALDGGPGRSRFLAFRKHGGRDATLAKAREIERELLSRNPPVDRRQLIQRNNRSGVVGVTLRWKQYGSDWQYLYACGCVTDAKGRQRAFGYSIQRHGLEGALRLAIARRGLQGAAADRALATLLEHHREFA